jgi:aquaporin Z
MPPKLRPPVARRWNDGEVLRRAGGVSAEFKTMADQPGAASVRPDEITLHDRRAQSLLKQTFGSLEEFTDPHLAYRRLFSEVLGTFLLLLAAAGGGLLHAKGQISLSAAVVAPGLTVLAIILFMGAVSGAHLNPVVSLAFALRGDFPWIRMWGYIMAQLVGAALGCLFLLAVFGNVEHLGATLPGPGYQNWQALVMEIALTAGLVSVILGTASAAQNVGTIGALGVGGYIALAGLWAAPVSGVSMNPARSFGPALVSGDWTSYWVYVVGPLVGALLAVGAAWVLRGRGGDPVSRAAGSGRLNELISSGREGPTTQTPVPPVNPGSADPR